MKDEVATFVCDHAEEIINLLIEDQKVLSDEALNKIHTKIIKEKVSIALKNNFSVPTISRQLKNILGQERFDQIKKNK